MIEKPKTDKISKNYQQNLLNNIGFYYNYLHNKFGALLDGSNKERWMVLEYDSMKDLKRPLKMIKRDLWKHISLYDQNIWGC